nr:VCBS repeat-containing protein [Cylindrospermum stagnale]
MSVSFATQTNLSVGSNPHSVTVGDFNGDGKSDLAVANFNGDNVSVLLRNAANTGFDPATNFSVGDRPISVTVGDFNDDGKSDLAAKTSQCCYAMPRIQVLMLPPALASVIVPVLSSQATSTATASLTWLWPTLAATTSQCGYAMPRIQIFMLPPALASGIFPFPLP